MLNIVLCAFSILALNFITVYIHCEIAEQTACKNMCRNTLIGASIVTLSFLFFEVLHSIVKQEPSYMHLVNVPYTVVQYRYIDFP